MQQSSSLLRIGVSPGLLFMTQHHQPIKNIIRSDQQLPAFSAKALFFPENQESLEKLTCPGHFEVPSFKWLPFKIEFPIQRDPTSGQCFEGGHFMAYARRALELEKQLFKGFMKSIDRMSPAVSEVFQTELLQSSVVNNMLRRLEGLLATQMQLVPGVYLGTTCPDHSLSGKLTEQLDASWGRINKKVPSSITQLVSEWGDVQSKARGAIIAASWNSVVNRFGWSPPAGFETNMGCFLEGQVPPPSDEQFWSWFSQIETLAESAFSKTLRLVSAVRAWGPLSEKSMPEELIEELREPGASFPMYEQYLRFPESVNARILTEELFPVERSRPVEVRFRYGVPYHFVITEQQALDFGSMYVRDFDPREITISYSSHADESEWRNLSREPEMNAIARTPLAQLISNIDIDCSHLSRGECLTVFEDKLKLLKALEEHEEWRTPGSTISLEIAFKNIDHPTYVALRQKCLESDDLFSDWKLETASLEPALGPLLTFRIPCSLAWEELGD